MSGRGSWEDVIERARAAIRTARAEHQSEMVAMERGRKVLSAAYRAEGLTIGRYSEGLAAIEKEALKLYHPEVPASERPHFGAPSLGVRG